VSECKRAGGGTRKKDSERGREGGGGRERERALALAAAPRPLQLDETATYRQRQHIDVGLAADNCGTTLRSLTRDSQASVVRACTSDHLLDVVCRVPPRLGFSSLAKGAFSRCASGSQNSIVGKNGGSPDPDHGSATDFLRRSFRRSGRIGPHGQRRAATMYVVDAPASKVVVSSGQQQPTQPRLSNHHAHHHGHHHRHQQEGGRSRRADPNGMYGKPTNINSLIINNNNNNNNHNNINNNNGGGTNSHRTDSPGPERSSAGSGGTHIAATVKNTVRRLLRRTKSHREGPTATAIAATTTTTTTTATATPSPVTQPRVGSAQPQAVSATKRTEPRKAVRLAPTRESVREGPRYARTKLHHQVRSASCLVPEGIGPTRRRREAFSQLTRAPTFKVGRCPISQSYL
jgi:hypothetical protein